MEPPTGAGPPELGPSDAGVLERLRVVVLSGIPLGALIGGVGGRLAMLLLRATSPDGVRGLTSDDGFLIGRVTLAGTYNLLLTGAGFGLLASAGYGLVVRWLIGPTWFRDVTTALGGGAVVGALLVHMDGIDFNLLKPTWLAVACFVVIPALFGGLVGPARRWLAHPGSWTTRGRRRWLLPLVAVACFPLTLPALALVAAVMLVWSALPVARVPELAHANGATRTVVQAAWLAAAVAGLVSLVGDITALV